LKPWAESAKVINNSLAKVMEDALSELEDVVEHYQEKAERAEAAL
jgi:hypothetical protein